MHKFFPVLLRLRHSTLTKRTAYQSSNSELSYNLNTLHLLYSP